MNKNLELNLELLNEILYDHSLIDGCKDKFEKCIYVFSHNSNKVEFKNMFDNNPYLYFTEVKIAGKLTPNTLKELKNSEKQCIVIIDGHIDTHIILDICNKINNLNIHLLFLTSNYSISLYKKLSNIFNDYFILIHKNTNLSNDKKFFINIINKLFENVNFEKFLDFNKVIINKDSLKYL